MRTSLGNIEVQPARTAAAPGWRDPRLWIGVALVAVSVVVGARIIGGEDASVTMWALAADRAPGDRIEPADLVATRVHFADPSAAGRYFRTDESLPVDLHLQRGLGQGELLPRAGLGKSPEGLVHIAVAVAPTTLPPGLGAGAVVDLWAASRNGGEDGRATQLLGEVTVLDAPRSSGDLGAGLGDQQVVLAVPDRRRQLARVLAASNAGELMIVGRR